MSNWTITVPEATTNIILNSSLEYDAIGATSITSFSKVVGTETYLLDNTYSHHGIKSVKIVTAASADSGIGQDVSATTSASTQYTLSCYAIGTGTVKLFFYDNGSGGSQISATYTLTSSWQRFTLTKTFGNGAFRLVGITTTAATAFTFWVDDFQLEQKDHATTYCDGDQAGCTWAGLRHGSTSSRAANYRLAGREYDIQTQYGLRVRQFSGAGVPDYELMTQDLALQPGSVFLRDKINARVLTLVLDNNSPTAAGLHSKRKAFWNVIKPDAFGQSQPFLIGYSGAASGKTVYGAFRYAGGWGLSEGMNGGANTIEAGGAVGLRLLEVDPFWYADDQETAALDYTDDITSNNRALARINGAWQNLGSGFNNNVLAIAADTNLGRVYFGGVFSTANGVPVNGVTYWNGTTFVAMGGTAGVSGGNVYALAIAPNGDVWVGGAFTSAGGATADGLARWNVAAGNWTCFTNGTPGDEIHALAIDKNGKVYIGGVFLNWDGNASSDNLVSYNGAAFAPLSTGADAGVYALAIGTDGTTLYIGGIFSAPKTRVMSWNGSAFSAMGNGASADVYAIEVSQSGKVYVGGNFTTTPSTSYIAVWNGSTWNSLVAGVNNTVWAMDARNQVVLVAGDFTAAGDLPTTNRIAFWNGSTWYHGDAVLPSTPTVNAVCFFGESIFIGYNTTGTATVAGRTTVTVLSTAPVYPVITITGTTTAASTSTLQWLENQTTGERLYFNLTINTGEIITIDLRPTSRKVTSNWRGQIFDQPLPTSDFSSWHLVSGSNTVSAFMTGTVTGATMTMNWQKIHASIDGEAA